MTFKATAGTDREKLIVKVSGKYKHAIECFVNSCIFFRLKSFDYFPSNDIQTPFGGAALMSIDSVEMLKKVTLFDAGITLISLIISILFFREYTSVVIIGIAISIVNFLLNTVATSYSMKLKWGAFLVLAGSLVRLALAGGFAVFLYRGNILNVVAYITGYSLHYVAIILGVMTNLHKNRGKVNQ